MLAVMVVDLDDLGEVGIRRKIRREYAGMPAQNIGIMSERTPDAVKLVIMQEEMNSLIEMLFLIRVFASKPMNSLQSSS